MADSPDVQQPVAPSPEQQGDTASSGPQTTPVAAPQQTQPSVTPQQTPAPTSSSATASPSQLSPADKTKHVLGEIFQTIAGGKQKVWEQTPNGPVATYKDLAPGQIARGILAAAITGLASGYDPANRGKGPAMSSAFASGFKGEQEQRDKQATQQKQEAQETFTNKNASDELLMKKQRFAAEQQQSILDYNKTKQMMDQSAVRAKQEGIVFDQGQRAYFDAQDAKYTGEIAKGGKPIDDPKNPGQPLVFWDSKTAQQYANEHGKELVAPGEFDTKVMLRPDGAFVVMKTPLAAKEKIEWRFAQMDPKNPTQPLMKNGQVVPSGEKDQSGNVIPPTRMSGEDYGNKIAELDAHKKSAASAADLLSQAQERRAIAAKDAQYTVAQDQLSKAGNDPNAVDVSTGAPIVSDKNRGMLVTQRMTMYKAQEAAWQKAQKEFADLSPDQQTPEKRLEIEVAGQQTEELRKQWNEAATAPSTPADNMTRSLLRRFDGDPQKAAEYFDTQAKAHKYAGNLLPQDIDTIRKNLVAANQAKQNQTKVQTAQDDFGQSAAKDVLSTPANVQGAQTIIMQHLTGGATLDDVAQGIKSDPTLSKADKTRLLNSLPKPEAGKTLMISGEGKIANASPEEQKQLATAGYRPINQKPNPNAGAVYDLTAPNQAPAPAAPFGR